MVANAAMRAAWGAIRTAEPSGRLSTPSPQAEVTRISNFGVTVGFWVDGVGIGVNLGVVKKIIVSLPRSIPMLRRSVDLSTAPI
jgi:hypothetical protein